MNAQVSELAAKSRRTSSPHVERIEAKKLEQQQKHDWSLLNRECADIVQGVLTKWTELVASDANEARFQKFLTEHAGLFFGSLGTELVISQLQLGSEFRPDLVVAKDYRSAGLHYEFIELERPSDPLFNRRGSPSQRLNDALQQIRNWQIWLKDRPDCVRQYLPAKDYTGKSWSFAIIIGRRENSQEIRRKRNQISEQNSINIRSFDCLTDTLAQQQFRHSCSSTWIHADELTLNRLANPFFKAFTDKSWRCFLEKLNQSSCNGLPELHFITCSVPALIDARAYNPLLSDFVNRANAS